VDNSRAMKKGQNTSKNETRREERSTHEIAK